MSLGSRYSRSPANFRQDQLQLADNTHNQNAYHLHESVPRWMFDQRALMLGAGFLTPAELQDIEEIRQERKFPTIFTDLSSSAYFLLLTKIVIHAFQGPYAGSAKVTDAGWRPASAEKNGGNGMPTIACEMGYSESYPQLLKDMEVGMVGGSPTVSVCILVKFPLRTQARVACRVEVYRRDPTTQLPVAGATHVRDSDNLPRPAFTLLTCRLGFVGPGTRHSHPDHPR